MPLNIEEVNPVRSRWLELSGPLAGVSVLIKQASPREAERFRQRLAGNGILRTKDNEFQINRGREDDFFKEYATYYVLDWRGDITPAGTVYSAETMGRVLGAYSTAYKMISAAIAEESDFFTGNGSASSSK